jgi:hypothetical protein
LPGFAPAGYGDSVEKAKKDMLLSVDEMCEILKEQGRPVPTLEYVYKYDLQSFFNYFSFLNISKIGEIAGINPSLMRQYSSGTTVAGEKQYDKIRDAVKKIAHELSVATF